MTSLQMASLEEIRDAASHLCRDYLTGKWKTVPTEQLVVKRISGGLSNFLYYISLPEDDATVPVNGVEDESTLEENTNSHVTDGGEFVSGDYNLHKRQRFDSGGETVVPPSLQNEQPKEPKEVLLRIYGQTHGGDALESMITESVVFALLSERNFGPKLHGIFPGGRIEQYIPARALLTRELAMPKISVRIAEKMAEIHSLNIPMSKEPDWLWNCMNRWLQSYDSIMSKNDWTSNEGLVQIVRSFDYCEEMKWLKSAIDMGNYKVCFCHNDLQEGNVLYRQTKTKTFRTSDDTLNSLRKNLEHSAIEGTGDLSNGENASASRTVNNNLSVTNSPTNHNNNNNNNNNIDNNILESDPELIIIDFEYCAYNYRGFDLANHFIEWSMDYTNPEYPYYYHYKAQYPQPQQRQVFIESYLRKLNEHIIDYVPAQEEIDGIEQEVRIFSMFSHLFWSLWSVVNTTSNIEFGYWQYAVERLKTYKSLKDQYIAEHMAFDNV